MLPVGCVPALGRRRDGTVRLEQHECGKFAEAESLDDDVLLPEQQVDMRIVPKLVASGEGQGGKADLGGIAVPILVRSFPSW